MLRALKVFVRNLGIHGSTRVQVFVISAGRHEEVSMHGRS